MRTTPHLSLKYGDLTYDGGLEKPPFDNLNKIEAELGRLAGLAGIPSTIVLDRRPFAYDGGQGGAARFNLRAIENELTLIGTAASSPVPFVLDKSLAATDGGSSAAMAKNLLMIDAECFRLAGILDGGGPGPEPGTGDWTTGAGSVTITTGLRDVAGDPPYQEIGYNHPGLGQDMGSAVNAIYGNAALFALKGAKPQGGVENINIVFLDITTVEPPAFMANRNVRLKMGATVIYDGPLDGRGDPADSVFVGKPGTASMRMPVPWGEGAALVLEIAAP